MNKQDFIPPVYVPAAKIDDHIADWVASRKGLVKLPFSVNRKRQGTIGPWTVKLSDLGLGIPLSERLRMLCGDEDPCSVWLSGDMDGETFRLAAVHDRVTEKPPLYAEVARPASCFVIRAQKPIHCARGPSRCEKCKAADAQPATPVLLDICPEGDHARPTTQIGEKVHVFDIIRRFKDADEARAFAKKHGVTNLQL